MRKPLYSFEGSELTLQALRAQVLRGESSAQSLLIRQSQQYRLDLRNGRLERPFLIA